MSLFTLAVRILIALVILALFAALMDRCHTEQTGRIDAELRYEKRGQHIGRLQSDSIKTHGLLNTLITYATRATVSRDSAIALSDRQAGKLTYAQQVTAYWKALVSNQTLPQPTPGTVPQLTDTLVVDAGLKTALREAIERKRGDSLILSISGRDAQLLVARERNSRLRSGVAGVAQLARDKRTGGIWPFNAKRRKQLRQIEAKAEQVLQTSELKTELNP